MKRFLETLPRVIRYRIKDTTAGAWEMSDGHSAISRAERVKFMVLIATFMGASLLMALRLPD